MAIRRLVLAVATTSQLNEVSCSSLTACIGVGSATDSSDREAPLAEQYS